MESPLAWVGGKRLLGKQIIPLIPDDHSDTWRLYEGLQFRQFEGHYSIQRMDRLVSFGELLILNF